MREWFSAKLRKMNRKQFIQSVGATCSNWYYDWSFINKSKRLIIFGAFDHNTEGKKVMIFSEDWKVNQRGRKSKGYNHSREHIRLIEEEVYKLMTFPMESDETANEIVKIKSITPKLTEKKLTKVGRAWYAVDPDDSNPVRLAEELSTPEKYSEGARFSVTINAYERNPKARAACIAHHGHTCAVCGFDFARVSELWARASFLFITLSRLGKLARNTKLIPLRT